MVTRRVLLGGIVGGAGLLAAGRLVAAAPTPAADPAAPDAPTAGPAGLLDPDPVAHVVRRLHPAPTAAAVAAVTAAGVDAWLDDQLDAAGPVGPSPLATALEQLAIETMDVTEFVALHRQSRDDVVPRARPVPPGAELAVSLLLRRVLGDQPVLETMVELWGDVLHVHLGHDGATRLLTPFLVRDVLRPHALGRFDDLLVGVTTSPAMLRYLDGGVSRAGAVNENHARELLELHTVGVDAHDEDDVAAVARVLTGWVVDPRTGSSRIVGRRHDDTPVTVLGWTGSGSVDDTEDLLRHLARHPATALRVARAVAVRLVADQPSEELVRGLADVYLDEDTAIAPVLRALVDTDEFRAASGRKLRRPMEFTTAGLAGVGARVGSGRLGDLLRPVGESLVALDHTPHGWPAPNGYPDVAPAWVSSAAAIGRWRLATTLAAAADDGGRDVAAVVDELPGELLLARPDAGTRSALLAAAEAADDPVLAATALVLDLPAAHLR